MKDREFVVEWHLDRDPHAAAADTRLAHKGGHSGLVSPFNAGVTGSGSNGLRMMRVTSLEPDGVIFKA